MGTHPIFESDFDCLTEGLGSVLTRKKYWPLIGRKEKVIEQQV